MAYCQHPVFSYKSKCSAFLVFSAASTLYNKKLELNFLQPRGSMEPAITHLIDSSLIFDQMEYMSVNCLIFINIEGPPPL
jgi:hypothetical protein